ncbi:hypothetical protein AGLY_013957 [Aphis glycines]|uniref:Uncharacterized protein n=1 Tax=Aphis glycines TaxID=307491 RepID=A0A6G0T5Z9_APHGL|nr:hypothetical protein AGLY_013957 [Aphis glycines]
MRPIVCNSEIISESTLKINSTKILTIHKNIKGWKITKIYQTEYMIYLLKIITVYYTNISNTRKLKYIFKLSVEELLAIGCLNINFCSKNNIRTPYLHVLFSSYNFITYQIYAQQIMRSSLVYIKVRVNLPFKKLNDCIFFSLISIVIGFMSEPQKSLLNTCRCNRFIDVKAWYPTLQTLTVNLVPSVQSCTSHTPDL